MRKEIITADNTVLGFNVGMNCGEVAGQTVPHAHVHIIPRRRGDVEAPRGGVRGVIPEKLLTLTMTTSSATVVARDLRMVEHAISLCCFRRVSTARRISSADQAQSRRPPTSTHGISMRCSRGQ